MRLAQMMSTVVGMTRTGQITQSHAQHGHGHGHGDAQAEVLDIDADLLAEQIASVIARLPVRSTPRRIVDLGAGTGAGTFALLQRFPDARIIAVDSSDGHLNRLRTRAQELGVIDRVEIVQADLDGTWPDLGDADLVWASASLHHLADPDAALRQVRPILGQDGLLAVVELAGPPRFLPDDAPADRPGLEDRCHAAADRRIAEQMPHRGADWGVMLTAAGYTLDGEWTVSVDYAASDLEAVRRYALIVLGRLRRAIADELATEDLAALDSLLDPDGPHSILRRDDLRVRTVRAVWAARP